MEHAQKIIEIRASPEKVFAHMDDIANVGWHMEEQRSMPMMGGKLHLQRLSGNATGVGATYRWYGKVLGMTIDFKETVTKWIENREKVWSTIESPKMIIMSKYEMRLHIAPTENGTKVIFEIDYELPRSLFGKILGKLLAKKYANWCLQRACEDTKRILEAEHPTIHLEGKMQTASTSEEKKTKTEQASLKREIRPVDMDMKKLTTPLLRHLLQGKIRFPTLFLLRCRLTVGKFKRQIDPAVFPEELIDLAGLPVWVYLHLKKKLGQERALEIMRVAILTGGVALWNLAYETIDKKRTFQNLCDLELQVNKTGPTRWNTLEVVERTENRFEIRITRCLHHELAVTLGVPELTPVVCQIDNARPTILIFLTRCFSIGVDPTIASRTGARNAVSSGRL